jgi:outer membrane protein TolC
MKCLVFFVLLLPAVCGAATVAPEELVRQAQEHSRKLRALDLDAEAAGARVDQARAAGLPSLDAAGQAGRYEGLRDMALGPGAEIPAIESRYGASVTLTQPLYTGGRITAQKEGARLGLQAVRELRRASEADVRFQALTAYWNWSKAFHAMRVHEAAVRRLDVHLADMRNRFKAGTATANELLSAEVQLNRAQLRRQEAGSRIAVARARIEFLTGREPAPEDVPEAAGGIVAGAAGGEGPERGEVAALRLEAAAAGERVKALRAEQRPQVSLLARYEHASPNSFNFPPSDRWRGDGYIGIGITWNLWDWGGRKAREREATAAEARARLEIVQVEEGVRLEKREAEIGLCDAAERIRVAVRNEASARRNLQAAVELWKNGMSRHAELLDAHAQLTDAEYEVVSARTDLLLARAALDHAAGRSAAEQRKPVPGKP